MVDIRMQRLADVLVNYGIAAKPGEWVLITGDVVALPMLREIHNAVVKAGANPSVTFMDEHMTRMFLREASEEQLNWLNPSSKLGAEQADARIALLSTSNTRAMTGIDPKKMQQSAKTRRPLMNAMMTRTAEEKFRWALSQFPSEAVAQEANISLEEYEDFLYQATFCDRENPVELWQQVSQSQQQKVDWLKGKKHIKLQGPNIEVELSIDGRTFINADGRFNMPDGEIFTGPVEDSVNGWVHFSYPSIVGGRAVSGIALEFVNGKVVKASAEENDDLLQAQLNTDEGARYLGEFAIGTNFGITQFTGNILFDEKIGGTIHMAIGASYPETGGKNESAVHWDMICDMRNDSEIYVDGDLFYKNGEFVI